MNHDSPAEIRIALETTGVALKKRWGQNFMINRGAREKIVRLLDSKSGELVWEVGAGLGALSEMIESLAGTTVLFETDHGLVRHLEETFQNSSVHVVAGDFIDNREDAVVAYGVPKRVVGNLPHSSGAAIVSAIVEHGPPAERMVFTLQKEVVERMCAKSGSRTYSSFSAVCQAFYTVVNQGDLQPGSFYPVPEVHSGVITMDLRPDYSRVIDKGTFFNLVRSVFSARRKTLRNNLLRTAPFPLPKRDLLAVVQRTGIELGLRAEALTADQLVDVSNQIHELVHRGKS